MSYTSEFRILSDAEMVTALRDEIIRLRAEADQERQLAQQRAYELLEARADIERLEMILRVNKEGNADLLEANEMAVNALQKTRVHLLVAAQEIQSCLRDASKLNDWKG